MSTKELLIFLAPTIILIIATIFSFRWAVKQKKEVDRLQQLSEFYKEFNAIMEKYLKEYSENENKTSANASDLQHNPKDR
jgi:predicted negative regulator of RcsB-dependent stress response